jgi:hypothetical protein
MNVRSGTKTRDVPALIRCAPTLGVHHTARRVGAFHREVAAPTAVAGRFASPSRILHQPERRHGHQEDDAVGGVYWFIYLRTRRGA